MMKRRQYKYVERVKPEDAKRTPVDHTPPEDLGYELIRKERYTTQEFAALEWERLWKKVWQLGALERDLEEVGSYFCLEVGPESVFFVRQKDGSVKAFNNVCPHRGNRIVDTGIGEAEKFKCSYHGWTFGLNGKFKHLPNAEVFPQGAPCSGLQQLPCAVWGSFIWFSLDPDAIPFDDYISPLKDHLEPYHFERMFLTRDVTIEWDCNWKTSVDAFNETYHVSATHPQLLWYLNDLDVQIDCYERHSRYLVPFGMLSPHLDGAPEIPPPLKSMLVDAGLDPASYSGPVDGIRKTVQNFLRENGPEKGYDFSELNDDQLTDDYNYLIFPNLTFNTHADHLMLFRHRPNFEDPNKMFFDVWTFALIPDEDEQPEERPRHKQYKGGEKSLGMVIDQDGHNLPKVQKGMNSDGYKGLWLGDLEVRIRHFHKVISDYIYGPDGKGPDDI